MVLWLSGALYTRFSWGIVLSAGAYSRSVRRGTVSYGHPEPSPPVSAEVSCYRLEFTLAPYEEASSLRHSISCSLTISSYTPFRGTRWLFRLFPYIVGNRTYSAESPVSGDIVTSALPPYPILLVVLDWKVCLRLVSHGYRRGVRLGMHLCHMMTRILWMQTMH